MSNIDNQEGNPVELFKSLLDTMKTLSNNAIQSEKENNETVVDNSSSEESSEDEGDCEESEGDCEDEYDEEQTKLKLFNNLLESHRLLCEAFSMLYKH